MLQQGLMIDSDQRLDDQNAVRMWTGEVRHRRFSEDRGSLGSWARCHMCCTLAKNFIFILSMF